MSRALRSAKGPSHKARSWTLLVAVGATLVAGGMDQEIPVISYEVHDGVVSVSYWEKMAPRVTLSLDCDESRRACTLRAFRSYGPPAWFGPGRQEQIALPAAARDYSIVVGKPDFTGEAK